jgi:glycosyltransferase involved in cell wall biosynthesis
MRAYNKWSSAMHDGNEKIALVTPWFGTDETNGSQLLSSQLVRELFASNQRVDVLTTCAKSFHDDWSKNYHAEGASRFENFALRRFHVRARDTEAFNWANAFLLSQPPEFLKAHPGAIPDAVSQAFCRENIQSPGLLQYLADWGRQYRAIIFTPYLYGPVLQGVNLVADRAFLQPCLHDEGYAYLPQTAQLFRGARGLLFNSSAEYDLARELYGQGIERKSTVVGHWVNPPQPRAGAARDVPAGRYVLYLGRIRAEKNVDAIVKAFRDYRRYRPASRLQLVLAGHGDGFASGAGVHVLGKVSERRKSALLSSCVALLQPSVNESFSRSVMEAWSYSKPVAVNAQCAATAGAVSACDGGWLASGAAQWIDVLSAIDRAGSERLRFLGGNGLEYYARYGTPERVLQRYRDVLGLAAAPAAARG